MQFDIWDTAGQERFQALGALYYKNSKGALVVYDITSEKSFQRAKNWISELMENAEPDILITLVGNKQDLEQERKIGFEEANNYAESAGLLFYECSAKTGAGVQEAFSGMSNFLILSLGAFSVSGTFFFGPKRISGGNFG